MLADMCLSFCLTKDMAALSGEFAMIKYSRAGTASIPHERVFKLDSHNLVCI